MKKESFKIEKKKRGTFVGFVLTTSDVWSKTSFLNNLKENWNLILHEEECDDKEGNSTFMARNDEGLTVAVTSLNVPVPNGEAEFYAKGNYTWHDAEKVVHGHTAHLILMTMGEDVYACGKLFVQAADALLQQDIALALYTDGVVFSPQMYHDSAAMMKEGDLPILNWVWLGIHQTPIARIVYTYGMRKLGFEEMEYVCPIKNDDLNAFNAMRSMMLDIVTYVLVQKVQFQDGETLGFTLDQKLPISYSKGIAVEGNTFKITNEG